MSFTNVSPEARHVDVRICTKRELEPSTMTEQTVLAVRAGWGKSNVHHRAMWTREDVRPSLRLAMSPFDVIRCRGCTGGCSIDTWIGESWDISAHDHFWQ